MTHRFCLTLLILGICLIPFTPVQAVIIPSPGPDRALRLPAAPTAGQVGDGTPGSCTESALDNKLGGGGTVTFSCGGLFSFFLTAAKNITQSTTIDGAGGITLDGSGSVVIFSVMPSVTLSLKNVTLNQAYGGATDGGAIKNHGTLRLDHSVIQSSRTDSSRSGGAIFSDGPVFISDSLLQDNQAGSAGALFANFGQAVVTISNSTFQRNQAISGTTGYGGAIWVGEQAQVTISGGAIMSNSAQYGGGLYLSQNATVTLTSAGAPVIVSGNSTTQLGAGGGVYNSGGTLTLTNSTLSGNSAPAGGGIFNDQVSGVATLTNVTLSGNSTTPTGIGGGFYNHLGVATFRSSTLSGNSAREGGGIENNGGTATLTNVTLSGNSALYKGGGIDNYVGPATLTNSTLSGNSAGSFGGGLFNEFGTATLTNSTLSGNSTQGDGGGIYNYLSTAMLTNVTLNGNSAQGHGGGIYQDGTDVSQTITLENTIVAFGLSGANCYTGASSIGLITSNGHNLSNGETCVPYFNQPGDLNGENPDLGPLENNSGPTLTHLPNPPSKAIDAIPLGSNGCGTTLTTDQRGAPRPINGKCDIGAVEAGWEYLRLWLALVRR